MKNYFCIFLYLLCSTVYSYAVEFELSDIIKQARETEIAKHKQIVENENNIKNTEKQNITGNNNSEQITNSANNNNSDLKKEQ